MHATALKHLERLAEKPWNAQSGAASLSASVRGFNTGQHGMCVLAIVCLDELCQPCLHEHGLALPYQLVKEPSAEEGSMKSIVHGPPCWLVGAAREGRCQGA